MVANRDYAKLHMGVRVANQPPRTASQYSGSFSRLRSSKTFHTGKARFKILIRCGKFLNFKIPKPKKKRNFKILNSAGLCKFIKFEIAKF